MHKNIICKWEKSYIYILILFLGINSLLAAPSIERASLRTGLSPRVKDHSWTELKVTIKNPDPLPKELTLRLSPEESFFSAKKTVFNYQIKVPANCEMDYRVEAVAEGAESFKVELFEKGNRIAVSDSFLLERIQGGRSKKNIAFINDEIDLSIGAINQMEKYKKNLFISALSAKFAPASFSLYKSFDCVVILRPDFKLYSEEQIKAIIDYACSGGKVIFADPVGTLNAASTQLAQLLPVKPLSVKKINDSIALKQYFANFESWNQREEHVDFLDSLKKNDAYVMLREGSSPLFALRKYGTGSVFFSAIPLTEEAMKKSGIWEELIEFAYINELNNESSSETINVLDSLTGFSIPGNEVIRKKLMILIIPMIAILLAGLILRKGTLSWCALAIFAILMTLQIFSTASSQNRKKTQLLLASMDMIYKSPHESVLSGRYSFFSRNDTRINLQAINNSALFSGITPDAGVFMGMPGLGAKNQDKYGNPINTGFSPSISEPIEVNKINGIAKIANLQIKANSLKQFQQFNNWYSTQSYESAGLNYSQKGIETLGLQALSFNEKIEAAAVIFPAGIAELKVEGDKLRDGIVSFSALQNPFFKAIQKENPSQFAVLAILFRNSQSEYLPEEENSSRFEGNCIKALLLPLKENFQDKKIIIPFESTIILAADQSTRMFANNPRNFSAMLQDDNEYRFKFRVPPQYAFAKTEKIEVMIDYVSESGNILIKPYLLKSNSLPSSEHINQPKQKKNKSHQNQTNFAPEKINFSEKTKNTFVFIGKDIEDIIDLNGSALIILEVKIKNKNLSSGQKIRDNQFSIKDFKISVSGKKYSENIR